jgi:hypothetical protein
MGTEEVGRLRPVPGRAVADGWIAHLASIQDDPRLLAKETVTLCRRLPADARAVYRRLDTWGGHQAEQFGLSAALADVIATEIADRVAIARVRRQSISVELSAYNDHQYGERLRYSDPCNHIWDFRQEDYRAPVRQLTAEEIQQEYGS